MATGITKHEQQSANAISAWEFHGEASPLPKKEEEVTLTYSNKASCQDLLQENPRQFIQISSSGMETIQTIPDNSFVLNDNLYVLRSLLTSNKKVTLFYLDPPYRTGFDFQSRNLEHSYEDNMGQAEYIEFMRRRLILMRECMSEDGSIYVQIGHQMLAYLKIVMDDVFGSNNFRNLITRRKCSSKNFTRNQYANIHDYILFYTKSSSYKWNQPGLPPEQEWIDKEYPKTDKYGRRYKLVPIHAPGVRNGETGKPWRGMLPPPGKHWQYIPSKLEELDRNGDIHWSRNGNPRRKVYLSSNKRLPLTDYWDHYRDAHHQSVKVTGYPTEKNLNMLKMIVGASSDPEDLVVDPFCGSGTTMQAAQELERRYIGSDASFSAAAATIKRMKYGLKEMGDYVNKQKSDVIQLSIDSLNLTEKCHFVTDKGLYEEYEDKINDLIAI